MYTLAYNIYYNNDLLRYFKAIKFQVILVLHIFVQELYNQISLGKLSSFIFL